MENPITIRSLNDLPVSSLPLQPHPFNQFQILFCRAANTISASKSPDLEGYSMAQLTNQGWLITLLLLLSLRIELLFCTLARTISRRSLVKRVGVASEIPPLCEYNNVHTNKQTNTHRHTCINESNQ